MSDASPLLRRGLTLRHLRLLVALAETGQVQGAAVRLGVTQPAASRLLADLEAVAGHPVHERTGRGVALTEQGRALARRGARVLLEIDEAGREMSEIGEGLTGHVRIGAVTAPALDFVLPAVRAARLSMPNVTVEVEVATSDQLSDQLLAGRLDFSISRVAAPMANLLESRRIAEEPIALVVRTGHHLAGRDRIDPADLLEFDWVMPGPDSILRRTVERRLRELDLPVPRIRLATSSFLLTLALIQQSNAVAPLALAVARQFAGEDMLQFAILPDPLGIVVEPFGLVTRAGARLPPAADRICQLILRRDGRSG